MSEEKDYEERERKDLPQDATPRERLKYIREYALFNKSMFGDVSYNDIQSFLDKIIEVSNV